VYRRVDGTKGALKDQGIIFFSMERKLKLSIGNRMFIHHRIVSAVMRAEIVSDTMLYSLERSLCNICVLFSYAVTRKVMFQ
jgi:hypothetical protein